MKHLLLLLPLALFACNSEEAPDNTVGMANPASVYCAQQGGTSEPGQTPEGEISICVLPGDERIEEWALYHRDHPTPAEAEPAVEQPAAEPVAEQPAAEQPAAE